MPVYLPDWLKELPEELPKSISGWNPFSEQYPELELPRYTPYGGAYPTGELPTYEPFAMPYPGLELPRYEAFARPYPELGGLYPEAGDVIGRLLRGEVTELPIEDIMGAYRAEEAQALEEYMPGLRESWAARGLLRSGMEKEAERGALGKAAVARGTYRAELEKENVIRQQEGMLSGLNLAMQHVGMGYGAQQDMWSAAQNEYTKEYSSALTAGMSEYEARASGWNAAMNEYTKRFSSSTQATQFAQGIAERAYTAAMSEYRKVYDTGLEAGQTEFEAKERAFTSARDEYARVRELEFSEWQTKFNADLQIELGKMGLEAQQAAAGAQGVGSIIGGIISIILASIMF